MGFQAYQDIICLPLLWQMKDLIVRLASAGKKSWTMEMSLFGKREQQTMEETYQLRYPGEVLERYKDRCGDTIENMRALAIALAENKEFLEADMFVGNQKEVFISNMRSKAETDIYLSAALWRLTDRKTEKEKLKEKLLQYVPKTTEEYVYLQSVFFLELDGDETNLEIWNYFFGVGRTIKAFGNECLYAWFLNHFGKQVKDSRKKGVGIVKLLLKFPIHRICEGSTYWERLLKAGYSRQEICFLNIKLPFLSNCAERIRKDSITMERIAAQGCEEIMNAEKVESPLLFKEVEKLLTLYHEFSICLEEKKNLTAYLEHRIKIRDVELFLYLYARKEDTIISDKWLLLNLLEDRWDKLADVFSEEEYILIFEKCFWYSKGGQESLWLAKYEKLCGKSYFNQLWKHKGNYTQLLVRMLVQDGSFKLVEKLEQYIQERKREDEETVIEKWAVMLEHMREATGTIYCHEVFRFWEVYEQTYGIERLRQFLGNRDRISGIVGFEKYSHHGQADKLWSGLNFLSLEEQKKLFYWECNELYCHAPSYYNRFLLKFFLKGCFDLFSKEECRECAETLLADLAADLYEARQLREMYYTREELSAYKEMEYRKKEEQKKAAEQKQLEKWKEELTKGLEAEDRTLSRLAVIAENARVYRTEKAYYDVAYSCVIKEMDYGNRKVENKKLSAVLGLLTRMVSMKTSSWKKIREIIQKLEVEEDELTDD